MENRSNPEQGDGLMESPVLEATCPVEHAAACVTNWKVYQGLMDDADAPLSPVRSAPPRAAAISPVRSAPPRAADGPSPNLPAGVDEINGETNVGGLTRLLNCFHRKAHNLVIM